MRKLNLLLATCCVLFFTTIVNSQLTGNGPNLGARGGMSGPPVSPRDNSPFQNLVNINGQDGFYLKKDLYLVDYYTIIDGQRVLGIPFLFPEWLEGSLTTPDGRVYTDYKYKYNVENQTVSFLNKQDSLEVNENIKEFTLKYVNKDSVIQLRFVNSNQYPKKGNPTGYFEVLLDDPRGQLLKLNKKVVANSSDGIISNGSRKYLKAEPSYFYYDKTTKKMHKIKENTDITSVLPVTKENAEEMHLDTFDLSMEDNIIRLFKSYFEQSKLKGF